MVGQNHGVSDMSKLYVPTSPRGVRRSPHLLELEQRRQLLTISLEATVQFQGEGPARLQLTAILVGLHWRITG